MSEIFVNKVEIELLCYDYTLSGGGVDVYAQG